LTNYHITLDIHSPHSLHTLPFTLGDKGAVINITLRQQGRKFHIPDGSYAILTALKPDGNLLFDRCVIQEDSICYTVTEQTTACEGLLDCDLRLYGTSV